MKSRKSEPQTTYHSSPDGTQKNNIAGEGANATKQSLNTLLAGSLKSQQLTLICRSCFVVGIIVNNTSLYDMLWLWRMSMEFYLPMGNTLF